ncbi:MAG: hypothetical protein KA314_17460 [Chloroflexi bacterium]|nr:hypothetical protein [Chloroflexota bacterium]MBP8057621.1 hypothetical protein [Chloroflexota bacterium]
MSPLWKKLYQTNRFLLMSVVVYSLLFVATIALSIMDTRLVNEAPVWIKPMKFAISSVLYCGTLVWMLSFVQRQRFWVNLIGTGTAIVLLVEIVLIVMQAIRGVRSHFNYSTLFDGAVFSIMGSFILVGWVLNLIAAILLMRQEFANAVLAWSVRLGLIITVVGAGMGATMTLPNTDQLATIQTGQMPQFMGAHSVGVEDGGAGLPFTGWSTEGGDLRIAHFVGLHALQFVPVLGLVINRMWADKLEERRRTRLVWIGAMGYLGLTILVWWQALRGQALLAPDSLTVLALAVLLVSVTISAAATILRR